MATKRARVLVLGQDKPQSLGWLKSLISSYPIVCEIKDPAEVCMECPPEEIDRYDVVLYEGEPSTAKTGRQALDLIKELDPDIELLVLDHWNEAGESSLPYQGVYRIISPQPGLAELAISISQAAERRQKIKMLRILAEVSTMINAAQELPEILRRTCQIVVRLFDVDHSGVVEFSQNQDFGWTVAEYPENGQMSTVGGRIQVKGIPLEERLVLQKQVLNITDVARQAGLGKVQKKLLNTGIKSILIVPIIDEDRVIASFSLDTVLNQREFTQGEIELCLILADQVAVAIRNARLLLQAQQGYRSMHGLFRNTKTLLSIRERHSILQNVVKTANKDFNAWRSQIFIMDQNGTIKDEASVGFEPDPGAAGYLGPLDLSKQVLVNRMPVFVPDTQIENAIRINSKMLSAGIKAYACIPLCLTGQALGVVWLHYREPHEFSDLEIEAFDLFGQYVALAYSNADCMHNFLHSATQAISEADRPKAVRQAIVRGVLDVLDADAALLWDYEIGQEGSLSAEGITFMRSEIEQFAGIQAPYGRLKQIIGEVGRHPYLEYNALEQDKNQLLDPAAMDLIAQLGYRAFQGNRLEAGDEHLGGLVIFYQQWDARIAEARPLFEEFSNYASFTLKLTQTLDRTLRSDEDYRSITQMSAEGNLRETLKTIVAKARALVDCDVVTLYLHDPSRDSFFDYIGIGPKSDGSMTPPELLSREESAPFRIKRLGLSWHEAERVKEDSILNGEFVRREGIRSSAGLSLKYKGELVGVMFVNYRRKHRFTQRDQDDLRQFGNTAALAIYAQLKENERNLLALDTLRQAGRVISSGYNDKDASLESLLNHFCTLALELMQGKCDSSNAFSHIALTDGRYIWFKAASNPEVLESLNEKVGRIDLLESERIGVVGRTVKTGQAQRVSDLERHPDYISFNSNVKSQLTVPLQFGQQTVGVLSIEHTERNAFDLDDERNLELLAVMASVALQNNRRFSMLKGLIEAGKPLTDRERLENSLETIARVTKNVYDCDIVTIFTYDTQEREISYPFIKAGELLKPQLQSNRNLENNSRRVHLTDLEQDNVLNALIKHDEPVFADDAPGDSVLNRGNFVRREGVLSAAGIPLRVNNEIVGFLFINYRKPHNFYPEERLEINIFSDFAAIAIEIARQYEQLREVKGMVGARTAVAWMSLLRSVWRHAIANYAVSAKASLTLMKEYLKDVDLPEETRELIEEQFSFITEDANSLLKLPITPPLFSQDGVEEIELNNFINDRVLVPFERELIKRDHLGVQVNFEPLAEPLSILANEDWMHYSLHQVLENAVQAVQRCPEKIIQVTLANKKDQAVIIIEDSGPGISPEIKARLFKKRIAPPPNWDGLGVGLLTVKAVLQAYGGDINLLDEPERTLAIGAALRIELPLVQPSRAQETL